MPHSSWHNYDHYGYAFMAIAGTFAAAACIQWALYRPRHAGWLASLQGVAPPFINIIGVLFGLTLAFLANDTWSAHDRATTAVHREADDLRSLLILASHIDSPLGLELRQQLVAYGKANAAEWAYLARRHVSGDVSAQSDALLGLLATPLAIVVGVVALWVSLMVMGGVQ